MDLCTIPNPVTVATIRKAYPSVNIYRNAVPMRRTVPSMGARAQHDRHGWWKCSGAVGTAPANVAQRPVNIYRWLRCDSKAIPGRASLLREGS